MGTRYKEEVIKTHELSKNYGKIKAVENLSITVRKGEIYGFLGLNGAGKTTTIQMLLGMVRPSSGEAYLNEKKISAGSYNVWNHVGHLVEIPYSYPELTVKENLKISHKLRLLSNPHAVTSVIEKLKLSPYQNRKVKHLSLGNAQRLGLAKALIHDPDILILDEPSNALDPAGIVEIRELLIDLASNKGVTIFISSHMLSEISKIATRVGIIHQGKLIQEMNSKKLHKLRNKSLLIDVKDKNGAISILTEKGFDASLTDDGIIEIKENKVLMCPENVNEELVTSGFSPRMLKVEEEELESYFLRLINKKGVI